MRFNIVSQTAAKRQKQKEIIKALQQTFPIATLKNCHLSTDPRHVFRLAALKTGIAELFEYWCLYLFLPVFRTGLPC